MKFSTFTHIDQTTEAPGKRLTLDCTGEISKQTVGALTRSKVNTIDGDLRLLEQILNEAPSYVHLTSGVSPYDEALAVPAYQVALEAKRMKFEDEQTGLKLIARSNACLSHPEGPALLCIDADGEGEHLSDILETVPELAKYARVRASSSGSGIYNGDNCLKGYGDGEHIFFHVADGRDIPRALEALHQRLLLAGHSRHKISKSGAFLERSSVDRQLQVPSQPIFIRSECGPGLEQRKRVEYTDGFEVVDTQTVIPSLSDADYRAMSTMIADSVDAMKPEMDQVREQYLENRIEAMVARGVDREAAETQVLASIVSRDLGPDFIVHLGRGELTTVREILATPENFHKRSVADPIEPERGFTKAMIYSDQCRPVIHSFNRGATTYFLHHDPLEASVEDLRVQLTKGEELDQTHRRGMPEWTHLLDAPVLVGDDTCPDGSSADDLLLALLLDKEVEGVSKVDRPAPLGIVCSFEGVIFRPKLSAFGAHSYLLEVTKRNSPLKTPFLHKFRSEFLPLMTYVSEDADGWHSLKKVFARASDIPKAEVDEGVLSDMLRDARFKEGDVIESINPKQKAALPAVSPEEAELERVIRSRAHVEALMESCSHIAQNPIGEFEAELKRRNVQGEFPIALLTLLVVQSSHLKKPLSGIVRGQSSSGKSFVSGTVVDLVPDEFKVVYTSGSAKSLIYEPEGFFRHKTLVLMEAESMVRQNGTEENQFAEMMRVLISENRLLYRTVDRNPATQMLETMEKVQEGPIGLLTTTVRDSIDPETETRMIPAYSDESVEQTKAIVQSIGAAASGRVKVVKNNLPWHDFARWLRFGPQDAVIPFGEIISDSVSYEAVRARRDITSIFACIKASALIHRLTREVNDDGLLVAELEDYAVAHRVLEASLKPRGHLTTAEEDLWVSLLSRLVKKEWFDAEVPWEKDDKYLPPLVQYVDAQAEWKVAGAPRYCPMTDMPTGFDEQYSHTPTEKQDFFAKCIVGQREVVAKELGISESTLYRGLKSLQTKGLVGQSFVKGTGGRIIVWIAENAQLSLEDTDEILPSPAALEAEWSALMENTNEDA